MATDASNMSSLEEFKRIEPNECFRQHIAQGVRPDGRPSLQSLRPVSLSVGTISSADASAVVKQGNTLVACGVTLELAPPTADRPDRGFFVPNVELPPLCHPRFRPGPPAEAAQVAAQFVAEAVDNSRLLDPAALCIRPGRLAWVVNANLVCLNYDGNIFDASLKALVAALRSVRLPQVEIDDEKVTAEEEGEEPLPEAPPADGVVRDPPRGQEGVRVLWSRRRPLPLGPEPAACTVAVFDNKLLVDPTDEEESLSAALVTVVLAPGADEGLEEEAVVHVRKAGGEAVSRELLTRCCTVAKKHAKKIRKMLQKAAPLEGL